VLVTERSAEELVHIIEVTLLLADAAQIGDGKLHLLGVGWDATNSQAPFAVAALVSVPWDMTNQKIDLKLELIDEDGHAVNFPGTEDPLVLAGEIEVGRPAGVPAGSSLQGPFAWGFGPMGLTPGRYTWTLTVGEVTARRSFTVIPS
jgi:hypothetical protein